MTIAMMPNQETQDDPTNPPPNPGGETEGSMGISDVGEPDFPVAALTRLDEMIHRQRWIVPVLPRSELEVLLDASINLCSKGLDIKSEPCQRFFREGCTVSFTKILTDDAVCSWKFDIHKCVLKNSAKLIELVALKLSQDWFPLLDLLAMVLNPNNKFHTFNSTRQSEMANPNSNIKESDIYAKPPDQRNPRGWLVDLINLFGKLGGFRTLLERFEGGKNLSVAVICAYLKPFGLCYEMLAVSTIETYFMPIIEMVPSFLENLTDEELKKEAKNEAKNDALSTIIKTIKSLLSRVPSQQEMGKSLEIFRLKMILRLLQISSFNGKMNALNEVNKVITNVICHPHRHSQVDEEEWLTVERMAEWIKENRVLQIVLRDSLHQPQYVEKLEKIIRFIIKEKTMTLEDLDDIWSAQHGKHEAIVKNVHDLLAKLAWDFSPEQLDHLFRCFQTSWSQASKKQREKLLELIRRLAEDDKDGVMAYKVLTLLWSLAHSDDLPTDIMDQALNAHVKILDYSCSQDRDFQKKQWLDKCVEELKHDKWVLPALKQIREICCSYNESQSMNQHQPRPPHVNYRSDIISNLQSNHSLVVMVASNLTNYMDEIKKIVEKNPKVNAVEIIPDGRYNHIQQVQDRLHFLRFLLKDGRLWLCSPQAKRIWRCLAEEAIFPIDRESCFKWFSKLMGEDGDPDLDPDINKEFFEDNILQLDPTLLTEHGMRCFDRFFRMVNKKEGKLVLRRRTYLMDNVDLIGIDYIWKVVLCSSENIAQKAIALLKETYTNLGPKLQTNVTDIHEDFISNCHLKLKAMYDTVSILERDKDSVNKIRQETTRMCRVLKVLYEYVAECDSDFGDERRVLPLIRAARGKHIFVVVRFVLQGRNPDDIEMWPHTNDTVGFIRRQVLQRLKTSAGNLKVELYLNNEILDYADDKRIICNMPIKDKTMLTAKFVQVGSNMASSPDSSSDSSTNSPQHPYEAPNLEVENSLPGVLMSMQNQYCKFLLKLADLGCGLNLAPLRDGARLLLNTMPADKATVRYLEKICRESIEQGKCGDGNLLTSLEETFFHSSPSSVLYNLQVLYAWLMPAGNAPKDGAHEFSCSFEILTLMKSGGVKLIINMLTKKTFLAYADLATKKSAFLVVLKVAKLIFSTLAFAIVEHEPFSSGGEHHLVSSGMEGGRPGGFTPSMHILQQALSHIPNPSSDVMVRTVSLRLVQLMASQPSFTLVLWNQFCSGIFPDLSVIWSILKTAWAGASGHFQLVACSWDQIDNINSSFSPDQEDLQVCIEGLETLSVALTLYPPALDVLLKEPHFHKMILSLVISSPERMIRITAVEQVLLIATKCSPTPHTLVLFIDMLFKVLNCHNQRYSKEYFQLLCGLLNWACVSSVCLPSAEKLLSSEIDWLKLVRQNVLFSSSGASTLPVDDILLDGHLCVTRELVAFLPAERKYEIGGDSSGVSLIKELVEDFIFPFSKVFLQLEHASLIPVEQAIPVCSSQPTVIAAYDLLVTLCTGCVRNLKILAEMLTNMYYSDYEDFALEWEFVPPVGPRPHRGFVGLKNAGATCYMNSVLQQLYMIRQVREGVLRVPGAAIDFDEDFSGEDRPDQETNNEICEEDSSASANEGSRKEYHIGILKQIQAIFGHLACSKLQYYVPRGLWRHFKLQGEPVNLREQHDACEFYNILVESINEAMKALGEPQILNKILGGSFSDQKICKTCPHRYSREEAFTVISIDIRNYSNLHDSLDQYVKGDLLEGDNAYLCEKCDKKVDTVKRICLKKLPTILAIQLKRFDYDWERECSIKFNDYFEFPRELDMEPYTVAGLARNGELIDYEPEDLKNECCSKYKLTGIVVHSGQASGGHYYSYILHRVDNDLSWYKFDDGEVSECKMEDEEEMKNQCFGGEYMGEQAFDNIMKRMNCRPRKRWWNAYLLFYTRLDDNDSQIAAQLNELTLADHPGRTKMPRAIERSVVRQNVRFMHSRSQFSPEYFQFMKKLITTNHSFIVQPPPDRLADAEEIALVCTKLASKFLFSVGFHTKKTLRGPASDWYEALQIHLRAYSSTRAWFTQNILFAQPHRFVDYLLECPTPEVRLVFSELIGVIAHTSREDPALVVSWVPLKHITEVESAVIYSLSDQLLIAVLLLLNKDVSEHGRHLLHYFDVFQLYANLGAAERLQLLKLNVLETLMLVALEDGPGHQKFQYQDASKMYVVVSQLVRCCDVSHLCRSSQPNKAPLKNPHGEPQSENLMAIPPKVMEHLFSRSTYIKKVIEEANNSEDTAKLVKFCSWENPVQSSTVLSELLWRVSIGYTYELRPYFELILDMLFIEDSWEEHRIHNTLNGFPRERDGIFDVIANSKHNQQKRAYQCIKFLVKLFNLSAVARRMLNQSDDLRNKWTAAVYWLNEELERNPYSTSSQQYYNSWSPPAPSNETTNGYLLERSPSARSTLEKACELCPEEPDAETEEIEEGQQGVPEESVPKSTSSSGRPPSPHQAKPPSTTQSSSPTSRSADVISPSKSGTAPNVSGNEKVDKYSKTQPDNS